MRPRHDIHRRAAPRPPGSGGAPRPLALAMAHLASALDPARPMDAPWGEVPPGWFERFLRLLRDPESCYARDVLRVVGWREEEVEAFLALDDEGFKAFLAHVEDV